MIKQRTLKNAIHATGVGVHSGDNVYLTLSPAPVDTGIIFRRVESDKVTEIPAHVSYIGETDLCTCLVKDNVRISTVEHLLSALAGLGVDNCYVDLSLAELPILDGSASPFVFLIESAGIEEQNAAKKFIRIKKQIEVHQGDKFARLEPYEGFSISFEIAFNHPVIAKSRQAITIDFSSSSYTRDLSRARTFGFLKDYEMIREKNLARGASLDNAIVLDDNKVINEEGLRYSDEFVKHKILDVVGDLYLLGYSMIGSFVGYKSGHALNNQVMHELLSQPDACELVTFADASTAPVCYAAFESIPQ